MKSSTATIISFLSLLFATSAEQLSASRLRKLQLQEALEATYTNSNANTDRALAADETDLTDLLMVDPCLEYSFEGSVKLPNDDPCSPTYKPTAAPSKAPTSSPTNVSTDAPTEAPTEAPTSSPSREPTPLPTTNVTDVGVVELTPSPTSQLTASPTTSPVEVTKEAGNIPIPVPEPCCDSCSCYDDDDDFTEYTDSSADGQYQYAGGSSKSSKSSKSGKSSKSSKSSSNNRIGVDTTTLRGSELLAFRNVNSAHSTNLSLVVAIAIAASISTFF